MNNDNIMIRHKDLVKIGYYFPNKNDETLFINAINKELTDRITKRTLLRNTDEGNTRIADKSTEGILNSDCGAIESAIKEELIEKLRDKRREVMLKDCNMTCDVI